MGVTVVDGVAIDTTELDREKALAPQARLLHDFAGWLSGHGYEIRRTQESPLGDGGSSATPADDSIRDLVTAFLDIDLDKVERERQALLAVIFRDVSAGDTSER